MKQSVSAQLKNKQRQLGFPAGDALFGSYSRCDGIEPNTDYKDSLISGFLKAVVSFSDAQKRLIYEQLIKSGFTP